MTPPYKSPVGDVDGTVTPDRFRLVMRQVASPVAIVASINGKTRGGITLTAICSATADPPTLIVCIPEAAATATLILASRVFSVNFLTEEQASIARLFSARDGADEAGFDSGQWTSASTGAPMLDGALSAFDCRVADTMTFGRHRLFAGRVVAALSSETRPLLYRDGFFRRMASEANP